MFINVYAYSPDIPMASVDGTIYTPTALKDPNLHVLKLLKTKLEHL